MGKKVYTKDEQEKIQSAIVFLVESFSKSGHNPKPVILHSIRVAMALYTMGESCNIVTAALLHDMLEDTDVTFEQIEKEYGSEVAKLVEANSFKSEIEDFEKKYIETFERNIACGRDAAIIKAVDLVDNADYYTLGQPDTWLKLYGKYTKFMEMSERLLSQDEIWRLLIEKREVLNIQMKIKQK